MPRSDMSGTLPVGSQAGSAAMDEERLNSMVYILLTSQRDRRIDSGAPPRRNECRQQRDRQQAWHRQEERPEIIEPLHLNQLLQKSDRSGAHRQAGNQANRSRLQSVAENEANHPRRGGADRDAD